LRAAESYWIRGTPASFVAQQPKLTLNGAMIACVQVAMTLNRQKSRPLLQFAAAVGLLVWVVATILCTADCAGGSKQTDCCHKDSSSSHDRKSSCLHSKMIAFVQPTPIAKPLIELPEFLLSQTQATVPRSAPGPELSGQSPDHNLLSTPEVCLGPAFRSLAPPVLL
jgi:hypothetical protein